MNPSGKRIRVPAKIARAVALGETAARSKTAAWMANAVTKGAAETKTGRSSRRRAWLAHRKRVLDIACGEGYGSNLLAAAGAEVIGIDIAPDVIAHAKRAYPRQNLIFREGSCLNIPMDDKSIDLVVSFETIEHLDDHEQFLREIKRVLSDSGALIISSPDKREYTDRIDNKNRFHKLELNHEDFYSLLKKHFKNCRIAKQRLVVGSWIAPDKTSPGDVPGTFGGDIGSVDFDLGLIGFEPDQLARILAGLGSSGLTDPDSIPPVPEEPVTRPGDLRRQPRKQEYLGFTRTLKFNPYSTGFCGLWRRIC